MAKKAQVLKKMGYRLYINRMNTAGADFWETAGFLFASQWEADQYRVQKHSSINKYRIEGVRVNIDGGSYQRQSRSSEGAKSE